MCVFGGWKLILSFAALPRFNVFFFFLAVEYGVRTCKRAGKESVRLSVRFREGGGGGGYFWRTV